MTDQKLFRIVCNDNFKKLQKYFEKPNDSYDWFNQKLIPSKRKFELVTIAKRVHLDWTNNFLSLERFASYYGVNVHFAYYIIKLGRELNK